jgi:hypothetical protein
MTAPVKLVDLELSLPFEPLEVPDRYSCSQVLVRLHGQPIGSVQIPVVSGVCSVAAQISAVRTDLGESLLERLVELALHAPVGKAGLRVEELLRLEPPPVPRAEPFVTVAVCTRDRPDDLAVCLEALSKLDYPRI